MKSKRVINSICDKMKDIPADSLIKNYFPVDYIDSFSKVMVTGQALTPEDFRNLAFSRFPKWIGWLMNFRNAIVKPLGLDTATRFTDMVLDKNLHEEILGMPDKHLDFHVSMWCGEYHEGKQELRITTVEFITRLLFIHDVPNDTAYKGSHLIQPYNIFLEIILSRKR